MQKMKNSSNLQKYQTKNPLKKMMLSYFNRRFINAVAFLGLKKPAILDAGCGEGFVTNLLFQNFPQAQISGIDANPDAVAYARSHLPPEIRFSVGDIYHIEAKDNQFDLVCATEVLEHLQYPEQALGELLRVAKKYLIVSVPKEPYFCLGNLLSGKNILRFGNPPDHINHYTFYGFKKFLRKHARAEKIKLFDCLVWTLAVIEKQ